MVESRRRFLIGSAATAAVLGTSLGRAKATFGSTHSKLASDVISLFEPLPGTKAVKIWAPAKNRGQEFLATLNPERRMFCASSFKGYVLCEALRQIDTPDVGQTLATTELNLDRSVWTLGSSVFNPPNLTGLVTEQTTLEAMISHSDNTGADMTLRHIGADNVRNFISSIGLQNTMIPNTTRQLIGYVFGAPNWETITWEEVVALVNSGVPLAHPLINDVQTMASSADDFVSFYSRALQGEFFENAATLAQFRRILMIADAILQVIPLGASAFLKGGSLDAGGEHALSIAGGMFFPSRWVYFAAIINWAKPGDSDPETALAFEGAVKEAFSLVAEALGD
jgi:beta-lactamase class A